MVLCPNWCLPCVTMYMWIHSIYVIYLYTSRHKFIHISIFVLLYGCTWNYFKQNWKYSNEKVNRNMFFEFVHLHDDISTASANIRQTSRRTMMCLVYCGSNAWDRWYNRTIDEQCRPVIRWIFPPRSEQSKNNKRRNKKMCVSEGRIDFFCLYITK